MPVDWPLAAEASLPSGFTVSRFASGLRTPRGLLVAPSGDVLVLERGSGVSCVTILWDGGAQRASCVASATGLNHGLAMAGGYLFASSITTVYRWEYDGRQRTPLLGRTVVVANMGTAADGSDLGANRGHDTRTLAFDSALRLYVSIGSYGNVDADSFRSRVRVFPGTTAPGATAVNFNDGEVWADGLRNEVGMAFDGYGTLWGVENGADNLVRDDMGDVHNDNPGEELNKLDASGAFYGCVCGQIEPYRP